MNHLLITFFASLFTFPLLSQVVGNISLADAGNFKMAEPAGEGEAHLIARGQDITYTIHFQNEGPDTAFNVRVLDTLSVHFDVNTLREESASHPYDMTFFDENVVRFSFPNIKLPNRSVNENGSKGYIRFTISQKKDLPLMTTLTNQAQIFFDFQPPVQTNEVYHRIGEGLTSIRTQMKETHSVQFSPHPIGSHALVSIVGTSFQSGEMEIFNLTGQSVITQSFRHHQFDFFPSSLVAGHYFYKIILDDELAATGRFILK